MKKLGKSPIGILFIFPSINIEGGRERGRERESERGGEREREREKGR